MANDQLEKVNNVLNTNKINLDLLKTKIDTALRPMTPRIRQIMRRRKRQQKLIMSQEYAKKGRRPGPMKTRHYSLNMSMYGSQNQIGAPN